MITALELVRGGCTGYRAARLAGLTPQAMYKNPDYRTIAAARRAAGIRIKRIYPPRARKTAAA
ncbi:hypothetical protein [Pararobbsia silviterrae]|nr:hypothetical protein [Pararobbsia silviterrae]